MHERFDPRLDILPPAQREIWNELKRAKEMSFVLYGGTAVALVLGHRKSIDFDFFADGPLDKARIRSTFKFIGGSAVLQDTPDTLVVMAPMPSGLVKVSFFGNLKLRRVEDPRETRDGVLLVASLQDLLATKLKAILDRAEAKDYVDIAALLAFGTSLAKGLSAFKEMFKGEPASVLRAIGFFEDGDLHTLNETDRSILRDARDNVGSLPKVKLIPGALDGC
jgi:hypothetical protein